MKPNNRIPLFAVAAVLATVSISMAQNPAAIDPTANRQEEKVVNLSTFVVSTERDRGYTSTNTAALRLDTELKKLPLPISVLNEEFIEDLDRDEATDLLIYTAAFNPDQRQSMRGLAADAGESATRNSSSFRGYQDASGIERMEILKGPAGLIYGLSNPGGRVNIFGIKARFIDATELSARYGSFESYRFEADINRRFGDTFAARLKVGYRHEGDERKWRSFDTRSYNFNSLWRPFATTEIELDVQHVKRDEIASDRSISGYSTVNVDRNTAQSAKVPFTIRYNAPEDFNSHNESSLFKRNHTIPTLTWRQQWLENLNTLVQVTHQWRSQGGLSGDTKLNDVPGNPNFGTDWEAKQGDDIRSWDYTFQAAYDFETGPVTNKLSAYFLQNYSYNDYTRNYEAQLDAAGNLVYDSQGRTRRATRTTAIPVGNFGSWTGIGVPADLNLLYFDQVENNNSAGRIANLLYQGDFTTGIGEFNALVGENYVQAESNGDGDISGYEVKQNTVRTNIIETNSTRTWSGGLVYAPRPTLQFYVAQTHSVPSIRIPRNSFDEVLGLEEAENNEFGFRMQFLNESVQLVGALFDTTVMNRIITDPRLINENSRDVNGNVPGDPGFNPNNLASNSSLGDRVAAGEYNSTGWELELNVNLNKNIMFKLEYINVDAGVSKDFDQSRIGLRDDGFVENTFTAIGKYRFTDGPLKGLFLGAGTRITSERYRRESMGNTVGTIEVYHPGVRRFDLFGGWNRRLSNGHILGVQVNIDNVTKDDRYVGVQPVSHEPYAFHMPIEARMSVSYAF